MSDTDLLPGGSPQPEYPDYRAEYIQSPEAIGTRKLARKWGVPYNTICTQCVNENWVEQRRQFQGKVKAESEKEAVETLAEARVRWAREYRTLQAVGLEALKTMKPRTAGEAARLLDVGIKGEALQRDDEPEVPKVVVEYVISERSAEEKAEIVRGHPELAGHFGMTETTAEDDESE